MKLHPRQVRQPHGPPDRRGGFTLVELLVVIAILALLLSILTPTLGRAKRLTQMSVCGSNLRQVTQGFGAYSSQSRGCLPPAGRFYNSQQMRYAHYWTEGYPSSATTPLMHGWLMRKRLAREG